MVISYDFGHGCVSDRGAEGILNEEKVIKEYGSIVVNELMRQGHTLINCTPVDTKSLQDSLSYRVNKANASNSQLHLCFHANAFNGTAKGAEIEVFSDNGEKYGISILSEICKLGFVNRGVKRPSLYVTKNTNMTAILIEPIFIDSLEDTKLYNPNTLGLAIAKGIVNIIGGNSASVVTPITPPVSTVSAINIILETQKFLNNFGFTDFEGKKLVEDGITGLRTKSALEKLRVLI